MDRPDVDVVVPVLNGGPRFSQCLDALAAQRDVTARVLVVDNGSSDSTIAMAAASGAVVLHEPVRSAYAARNRGVEHATADVVAFTDADCIPDPFWLRRGLDRMADGFDLVGGAIRQTPGRTAAGRHDEVTYLDQQKQVGHGFAATANLFVRAEVFRRAGLFSADLRSGGDFEFTRRCVALGFRLGYAEDAVVDHSSRQTVAGVLRKAWRISVGHGQLAAAERPRRLRTSLSPRTLRPNPDVLSLGEPTVVAVEVLVKVTAYGGRLAGIMRGIGRPLGRSSAPPT